jgi:hypothetical protein
VTATDHHPLSARGRFEVRHACPDCPTPLAGLGQLLLPARAHCRTCAGTGLVSEAELALWQARTDADIT